MSLVSRLRRVRFWIAELIKAHIRRVYRSGEVQPLLLRSGLRTATHIVVVVAHNEGARMGFLLNHYRRLGFDHFVVIDNQSDDSTVADLSAHPDVSLFSATGSYRDARFGNDWINHVLSRHCAGRWVLYVDADEFLVYAGQETRSIGTVTRELEAAGRDSWTALMLDMYSTRSADENVCAPGTDPLEVCSRYDSTGYAARVEESSGTTWVKGGVRARLFADPWDGPALNKTPLVRWRRRFAFLKSSHQLWPPRLNRTADRPAPEPTVPAPRDCVLLHFKFLSTFAAKISAEERRRQHTQEYGAYAEAAGRHFCSERTRVYTGWSALVDDGLLKDAAVRPQLLAADPLTQEA